MEVLGLIIFPLLAYVGVKALWISTLILDERKQAYRSGTHDYYGNKIEEYEDNG